ncbi:MAG TPA: carbohydrate ABC transporter permease, partial [Candidatus Avimonoglobus intestinipullorum]|nr:carbohydrate ABC transporter permease [Candidatus Avimonoglobus intestinipullorum]HIU47943.1 carbohydrate ABC transporter permease [Candidatus Avimonoglobus intestinipullorum]
TFEYTMDYQMLVLLFSVLPQLIIYAIFQRKIIGGINIGGVKG